MKKVNFSYFQSGKSGPGKCLPDTEERIAADIMKEKLQRDLKDKQDLEIGKIMQKSKVASNDEYPSMQTENSN